MGVTVEYGLQEPWVGHSEVRSVGALGVKTE